MRKHYLLIYQVGQYVGALSDTTTFPMRKKHSVNRKEKKIIHFTFFRRFIEFDGTTNVFQSVLRIELG